MTDAMALLLNLAALKENSDASFELELSRTFYTPDNTTSRKSVYVDGVKVCEVTFDEFREAAADDPSWFERLEKYTRWTSPMGKVGEMIV